MKQCLIIEDIVETRRWLTEIVAEAFPDCRICECATLKAAFHLLETETFDLALIDLGLPDGSGLDALRRIERSTPETTCVVTTVMGDDAHIVAALSAGARGYLMKEQPAALLSRQLRQLTAGVPALSPSIAKRIMDHFRRTGPSDFEDITLSKRERETLALIARGLRNGEVAAQLGIAESTVATHIKSIYRKLGITSRAEAAWHATRMGL